MTAINAEIRRGAYYDSVVLMQLQRALLGLEGVIDAGVVMGTDANKEILDQSDLLTPQGRAAGTEDLIIVVKGEEEASVTAALGQVDQLLARRRTTIEQEYQPKSLEAADQLLPESQWVLISTPGQYAAGVAREALRLGKHVFLYSDNVSLDDEIDLKHQAAAKGLLVMGPDCGTALVNGVGLGFANVVRRGPIGLVAASGTGLQSVSTGIHALGSGITHGIGTGGRDLSEGVGAISAQQALSLLSRDPVTKVIVLISKPPAAKVAKRLLQLAQQAHKPVVVQFIGYESDQNQIGNLHFAQTLDLAAQIAVDLAQAETPSSPAADREAIREMDMVGYAPEQRYLRGLYSGGTLAYEALLILQDFVPGIYSNIPLDEAYKLTNPLKSQDHTLIDLGDDVFTVGRLHPMMDNDLRIRRLKEEAEDPETAVLLMDVVLGYGAHPDPAQELAPVITEVQARATAAGRVLPVVVAVIGTEDDPQDMTRQVTQLQQAGARVFTKHEDAVIHAGRVLRYLSTQFSPPISLQAFQEPLAAINVGLASFAASLQEQGAAVIHVDWKPPAGGNERLAGILARMRTQ